MTVALEIDPEYYQAQYARNDAQKELDRAIKPKANLG